MLATIKPPIIFGLTKIVFLLSVMLALCGAHASTVSPERKAEITALSHALAPLVLSDQRASLKNALAPLENEKLYIAVIFDEDLTPIAHVGLNSAFQGLGEGEALSDPISLWAIEQGAAETAAFELDGKKVTAIVAPITLDDKKLASLLIVEQASLPPVAQQSGNNFVALLLIGSTLLSLGLFVFGLKFFKSFKQLNKQLNHIIEDGPHNWTKVETSKLSKPSIAYRLAQYIAANHNQYFMLKQLCEMLNAPTSTSIIQNAILSQTEIIFGCRALFFTKDNLALSKEGQSHINLGEQSIALDQLSATLSEPEDSHQQASIKFTDLDLSIMGAPINGGVINAQRLILVSDAPFAPAVYERLNEHCKMLEAVLELLAKQFTQREQLSELNQKLAHEHSLRVESCDRLESLRTASQKGHAFIGIDGRFTTDTSLSFCQMFSCDSAADKSLQEVVFSHSQLANDQIRQANSAVELLLDSDVLIFEFNKNKLPQKLTLVNEDGTRDELSLYWQAIAQNGLVKQLYLEVSSIARELALEAQVKALQQEVELVGQVLKAPADAFGQFILASAETFDAISSMLKGLPTTISQEQALSIYQDVHKLKRESRRLGLIQVTQALYQLELLIDTSHCAENEHPSGIEVLSVIQEVKHALQRYQHVDENILKRSESADQKGLSIKQVHAIRTQINALQGNMAAPDKQKIDQISNLLTKASFTTLSHVLNYIGSHCEDIAINLGKAPPVMHLVSCELWLADNAVKQVKDQLMQLVSHIICHSIETIPDRAKANKPPAGQIYVAFAERDGVIEITCKNDGRGISLERLARYKINKDNSSINAVELLSPSGTTDSSDIKKGNSSLPFTIQFFANTSGYQSYEGILRVPLALCWHDSDAEPIASTG